nr:MAG TPA: hypothetical protein [Caudoviricetes sp.]
MLVLQLVLTLLIHLYSFYLLLSFLMLYVNNLALILYRVQY